MIEITHFAGEVITIDGRVRQRCSWCGSILIDELLANVMVPVDQPDKTFPTWMVGGLVTLRGNSSWSSAHEPNGVVPSSSCARIDPEVTG